MDKGIVLVDKNGEVYQKEVNDETDNEQFYLRKYLKEHDYDIKEDTNKKTRTSLFLLSAKEAGLLVFKVDNTIIIYLPKELSEKQLIWYKQNKESIRKIKYLIVTNVKKDDDIMFYDKNILNGGDTFEKLDELMNGKDVYKEKSENNATGLRK